jgi:hypothetical protein
MLRRLSVLTLVCFAGMAHAQEQAPQWRYGEHPLLGLSAHVTVGQHSLGIRCMPDRGPQYPAAALMLTSDLVRKAKSTQPNEAVARYKFLGAPDWGEGFVQSSQRGFYESIGSTCEVNLDAFKKARMLLFFDDVDVGKLDDRSAERSPGIIARIPLAGAAAAIRQLERACPAIRKDIANNCGV